MKFIYWNNKEVPAKQLLEVLTDDILKADKILEGETNFNPIKCPWIGCEISKE